MTDARINELLALSERTSVGGEQVDAWCEMASSDDPEWTLVVYGMSEGVLALADEYTVLLATKAGLAEALEEIRRLSKILVEITLAAVDQVGGAPAVADARDAEIKRLRGLLAKIYDENDLGVETCEQVIAALEGAP